MTNKSLKYTALILLIYLSTLPQVFSQELEPRAYANAPVGLNFVVAGAQYSQGGLIFDPGIPIYDANSSVDVAAFGYLRTLDVAGMSAKVSIVLPYANLYAEGRDENTNALLTRQTNGLVDPSLYLVLTFMAHRH